MTERNTLWGLPPITEELSSDAVQSLAPEAPMFQDQDPALLGQALAAAVRAIGQNPLTSTSAAFRAVRQASLATRQFGLDLLNISDLDPVPAGKAELAYEFIVDALSPTNFPATN